MWCFKAYMAARDYQIDSLGMRRKADRKNRFQISPESDTICPTPKRRIKKQILHLFELTRNCYCDRSKS